MREMFLKMLDEIQKRLKANGVRSQIKLAFNRIKEPQCFGTSYAQFSSSNTTVTAVPTSSDLIRLLNNKHSFTKNLKQSYQKGISGRNGTCLYAQVDGMSFKVFFNNRSDRDVLIENGFSWDTESENENGLYIYHVTNTNGIAQRSYNIMTVASWSDDAVANPQWDPEIVINKTVDIIVRAAAWVDFCKANTERFFSFIPNRGKKRDRKVRSSKFGFGIRNVPEAKRTQRKVLSGGVSWLS